MTESESEVQNDEEPLLGIKPTLDPSGYYPNIAIDDFADLDEAVHSYNLEQSSQLDDVRVAELSRCSIYSVHAISEVAREQGIKAAEDMALGFCAVLYQCFIFGLSAVVGGLHPLLFEASLWNSELHQKRKDYVVGTVFCSYYLLSVLAGNVISLVVYGKSSLKDCWNFKYHFYMIPASAILAFVESMDSFILVYVDASMKAVVSQIRLPLIAMIGTFVLGRRLKAIQWCLITGVTVSVIGFSSSKKHLAITAVGVYLTVFQSCCAAIGSTVSEITFKKIKFPFCVQMSQGRLVSAVASFLGLVWYCSSQNETVSSLAVGWNRRVCLLVVWLACRDWVMTFALKSLSALWKSLASAFAVCISYLLSTITRGDKFDIVLMCFLFCLVSDILSFALSRKPIRKPSPCKDEEAAVGS